MMESISKAPGRVIPPGGEGTWMQKHYGKVAFLVSSLVGIAGGIYVGFILDPSEAMFMAEGIFMMVLFPILGLFSGLLITSAMQRPLWPVMLYADGVEFHQFLFDRLIRKRAFVPITTLSKVSVHHYVDTRSTDLTPRKTIMVFTTVSKSQYWTGPRSAHDVEQALEYIRKEWPTVQVVEENLSTIDGRKVSMPAQNASGPAKARKVAVQPAYAPIPPATYEARPVQPAYQQSPSYQAPAPPVPSMGFCPSCGAGVVSGARFCPACGHQFGPSVQSNGAAVGAGKSTQVAFLMSLLPGLVGLLGLGHFYVRKYAKGAFLLIIGFFLAGLGLASLLLLGDPAYAGTAAAWIVALFFNLLFLMLLVYSVIDARKSAQQFNMGTR